MSIELIDRRVCSGCRACGDVCPKDAIVFEEDYEGFFFPVPDATRCIECGACEAVCPVNAIAGKPLKNCKTGETDPIDAYAAFGKDSTVRRQSSSGGVFSLLAKKCLEQNGVVYGAAFDEDWRVVHIGIESIEGLQSLCGSKYVQSDLSGKYLEIEQILLQERLVLFSGLPCHIAALRNYLDKEYDNLLCVDLFCHGVGSPGVFKQYLQETVGDISGISSISFRDKTTGWENYSMKICTRNGEYLKPYKKDPYLWAFCCKVFLRESCYNCRLKGFPKKSDITLGDFWMVDRLYPEMNDHKGISIVLTHTPKGHQWLERIKDSLEIQKIDQTKFRDLYGNAGKPVARPTSRDAYYSIAKGLSVKQAMKKTCRLSPKDAIMPFIRQVLIRMRIYEKVRKMKHKLLNCLRKYVWLRGNCDE